MSGEQTVARVSLCWSVPIVVALSLPLAFYLDKYNFTLWVSFIAWAEYFVYGATPKAFKLLLPCWPYGSIMATFWMALTVFAANYVPLMWAAILTNFIALPLLVRGLKFYNFGEGPLVVFGGFTCYLGLYFTNTLPLQIKLGTAVSPLSLSSRAYGTS
jgi:hypothetical protein